MAYDKKIDMNKEDPELILGRMRCLEALGEWYVGSSSSFKSVFQPLVLKHPQVSELMLHIVIFKNGIFVMYSYFAFLPEPCGINVV